MRSTKKLMAEIDHLSKQAQVQQKALNADFGKMLKLEQADERKHEVGHSGRARSLTRLEAKVSGVVRVAGRAQGLSRQSVCT